MGLVDNPIFKADGGKLPKMHNVSGKFLTDNCAIAARLANSDPTRMKRLTIPHFRQSQTKAAFPIAGNLAVLRDGVLMFTAKLPQGEL